MRACPKGKRGRTTKLRHNSNDSTREYKYYSSMSMRINDARSGNYIFGIAH